MCGIAGMVMLPKQRSEQDLKILRLVYSEILRNTEDRGTDAAGIYISSTTGEGILEKNAIRADLFTLDEKYREAIENVNNDTYAVLGHTRAYTQGKPDNNDNNHPIPVGNVVGVHNGSVDNDYQLFNAYTGKFTRIAEVDSEIIFQLLNYYGGNDKLTFKQIRSALVETGLRGSFALAFIHKGEPYKIHLVKQTNPLELIYWEEQNVIFFNSKASYVIKAFTSLERAIWALTGEIIKYTIQKKEIKDDQYLTIDATKETFEKAVSKPKNFRMDRRYNWSLNCSGSTRAGSSYQSTGTTTTGTSTTVFDLDKIPIFVYDKYGQLISRDDGSGIIDLPWDSDEVCYNCKREIPIEDLLTTFNKTHKEKLCANCQMELELDRGELG